jgi:PAS domain S-box-containing protein
MNQTSVRVTIGDSSRSSIQVRAESLFRQRLGNIRKRTDRLFAWLLTLQWLAAIVVAVWVTPQTWVGRTSSLHIHVWAAMLLGAAIISLPVGLALRRPGKLLTRHAIAVSQMLMGALLIHLTGGRIETHFHVFGSLAFLAFYRDWPVLITASAVVAVDHFARGLIYPESVYGVASGASWRWVEHAWWVLFEDWFLIQACQRGVAEMRTITEREAGLEYTKNRVEDIVARRTAELRKNAEQLRQAQAYTRLIIETANDAFISMDPQGKVIDWNTQAEAIFGWRPREALGKVLSELIIPLELRETHNMGLERYLSTGKSNILSKRIEVTAMHRDGRRFPVELTVWPIGEAPSIRFNAFVHDITERKQTEESLRQAKEAAETASRTKSEFLANVSHEIRTPMNGIIGMTRLALDTELSPVQRDYLDMAHRSAESLLGVINDILDFSKIEAGKLTLDYVAFSLNDCVGDLMKDLSLRAHFKSLELIHEVADDVPDALAGDPLRLRQVLMNLLGNAIKFTEQGEVALSVQLVDRTETDVRLQFSVRDTGIGIAADKQKSIFNAFEQADNTTTRRYGGTGLGLSISAKLVEMMGGKTYVKSADGKGSTFFFDARFELAREPVARKGIKALPEFHGLRVLVVDDNETNRRILRDTMLHWRMKPYAVDSGPAALDALRDAGVRREPYALVILDAMMPEMDGFMVAEAMRRNPDYDGVTIMMLSSADRSEDIARCRSLGVQLYLTKPITSSELFDAIANALHLHPAADAKVPARTRESSGDSSPMPKQYCILLAEDNAINQRVAQQTLKKMGHEIITAGNGKQALELLAGREFDLILMDVQMPEMDGFEATQAIRAQERQTGAHIPIIAMTAHAMKGDRERCLEAGMDGYVSKPIHSEDVAREMDRVLAGSAAQQLAHSGR